MHYINMHMLVIMQRGCKHKTTITKLQKTKILVVTVMLKHDGKNQSFTVAKQRIFLDIIVENVFNE